MIDIRQVTKVYRRGREEIAALRDVSLKIRQGEFICIIGPSGSGKSTLLNITGLLDRPTMGDIHFGQQRVGGLTPVELNMLRRQAIGFIFQQFLLIPTLTALQNVMLPMYFAGVKDAPERAARLLARVGLEKRFNHLPSQLSGGEMQRTAIARALANKPRALLADEPTGNLDSRTAGSIYELFQEINRDGTTVVMVTHNPDLAAHSPRVITIKDGRIAEDEQKSHRVELGFSSAGGSGS